MKCCVVLCSFCSVVLWSIYFNVVVFYYLVFYFIAHGTLLSCAVLSCSVMLCRIVCVLVLWCVSFVMLCEIK